MFHHPAKGNGDTQFGYKAYMAGIENYFKPVQRGG